MTTEIAVVRPYYAVETAYNMGYDRFEDTDSPNPEAFDLGPYKSGASWSNTVLPKLRAMAGFDDGGHGTYQIHRQVAAVEPGCEEDEPADAELVEAQHIFDELVEAFDAGAYDAAEGRERDPDRAV